MKHEPPVLDPPFALRQQKFGSPPGPKFVPPEAAGAVENPDHSLLTRVIRLTAACRISQNLLLEHIRAKGRGEFAALHDLRPEVLEEIANGWPDIVLEISRAGRSRRNEAGILSEQEPSAHVQAGWAQKSRTL